jgi:hypothetical protein
MKGSVAVRQGFQFIEHAGDILRHADLIGSSPLQNVPDVKGFGCGRWPERIQPPPQRPHGAIGPAVPPPSMSRVPSKPRVNLLIPIGARHLLTSAWPRLKNDPSPSLSASAWSGIESGGSHPGRRPSAQAGAVKTDKTAPFCRLAG